MRECGGVGWWGKVRLEYRLCRCRCRCRCMSKISGLMKIEGKIGTSILFIHHGPHPFAILTPLPAPTLPRAIFSSFLALGQTSASPKLSWRFPDIVGYLEPSSDFGIALHVHPLLRCQILALGLTGRSMAVGWLLCAVLCGSGRSVWVGR